MNKQELINAVSEKAKLSKVDAKNAIDAFISVSKDALKNGDRILLIGFGTFIVSERPERMGLNPRTKEPIKIPAKKVVKFKPGKDII